MGSGVGEALRDVGEGFYDLFVGVALEGHDERRRAREALPAPGVELGVELAAAGRLDIDLALVAGKGEGEPALALAAIFALQRLAQRFVGEIVIDPFRRLGEKADTGDIGLFVQFAARSGSSPLSIPPCGICQGAS
jgi:hypothetical protein